MLRLATLTWFSSWCRWSSYTDANGVDQEGYCSVVHQHTQGVLNYMFVGEKLWRLENHTMPGHTMEVTQVPGDLIWLPPGWFHSVKTINTNHKGLSVKCTDKLER
eukprot:COSAG01_NODE_38547_length_488_cov_0.925450_1_plen_104_part_10